MQPGAETRMWQHVETTLIPPVKCLLESRTKALHSEKPGLLKRIANAVDNWLTQRRQEEALTLVNCVSNAPTSRVWAATIIHPRRSINDETAGYVRSRSTNSWYESPETSIRLIFEEAVTGLQTPVDLAKPERWDLLLR